MSSNKKIIVISIVLGIISLGLIYFLIYPLFEKVKEKSKEFVSARQELILAQGKTGEVGQLKKLYADLETDLEKTKKLFVDPEVPVNLIEFWEKTAKDSEISISISPIVLKIEETDSWNSIGFQLVLVGSFPDFLKFLEKIETGPYLIKVQNLTVKKTGEREFGPEGNKLSLVNIGLLIKVFTE